MKNCGKRNRSGGSWMCVGGWAGGKMRRKREGETDILEMAAGERQRGLVNELGCTAAAASP